MLQAYNWPGNVRELENAVERAVVLSKSRTLKDEDFSFLKAAPVTISGPQTLKENEKEYVYQILVDCDWNVTAAAKTLDVNRVTLHRMIKRYGLKRTPSAGP